MRYCIACHIPDKRSRVQIRLTRSRLRLCQQEIWVLDYKLRVLKQLRNECTRTSSIKPFPPGLIYFKPIWGSGGIWEGGLFNLETMMVSVVHKELEYKVEELKYKEF